MGNGGNAVVMFSNEQFGSIRIEQEDDVLWFIASDVARALGYSQTSNMNKLIDDEDKRKRTIQNGVNHVNQSLITEAGLYQAIMASTLPAAKAFKRWVMSEVLPSIRKTGQYQVVPRQAVHVEAVQAELLFAETAARMLNVSNSGKLGMLQTIQRQHGLPNLLPSYAVDAPSDATDGSSRPTFSATEGLKQHGVSMGVRYFNALLESNGLLTKMRRPSTKSPDKQKEFWAITPKGLLYGKNIVDPRCQRETQPHWYQSRFAELLAKVGLGKVAA
ncbi:BRO family protein [Aeromonas caviae]|uniref:BRO-N domain-containing protein n=1 Tax=Aeromonas caviae TaxID=648 RepID=UPI00244B5E61|nr:BRO family protein [Aeromonas caviae]MDH1846941.1 BRO family protein [Aeromonas caviae]